MREVRHPNLLCFLGCSKAGAPKRCLVYELMDNGSLEDRLARKGDTPGIPWETRVHIAFDTIKGINYLHHNNYAHRCCTRLAVT